MTARANPKQACFLPAKTLRRLLQEQPTPFYIYDAEGLRETCREIRAAFSWNAGFRLYFPARMNPNPAVLRVLEEAGCGALCQSEAELRMARLAGVRGEDLIYASFACRDEGQGLSRRLGAIELVDDEHALPRQAPQHVLLSVNPGGKLMLNGRAVWDFEKSKLGMKDDVLSAMCRRFQASQTASIGLAVFLRDQEPETERFRAAAELLLETAVRLYETMGLGIESILISGGLGASYRASDRAPDWRALSDDVRERYARIAVPAGLAPKLLLAPGRALAAKHGLLVTRVLAVKQQAVPLVVLDADFSQFLREIAFGASHRMIAPLAPEGRSKQMVRAAGALNDLRDHFTATVVLPEVKLGECVVIRDVGADGRSLSGNYGGSLGCAEFLLEADGSVRCIRRRQTAQELFGAFSVD